MNQASEDSKKVYFISDLHLGASYIPDRREQERRICAFLDSIAADASDLYLLGDVLDYWFEYRTVVPRGYIRFFGALARLVDGGVRVHWFIGNHDIWLFDYLRDEIGIEVVDGYVEREIKGKLFFMTHGDGVGRIKPMFRLLRNTFRCRVCQKLYASIHPRWTIPFAHGWSKSSRGSDYSSPPPFEGETEALTCFCRSWLAGHPDRQPDYFVFGHRHALVDYRLNKDSRMIILGDWISQDSYAVFDGDRLELRCFSTN